MSSNNNRKIFKSPLAIAEWIEIAVELERDKYKTVSASDSGVD